MRLSFLYPAFLLSLQSSILINALPEAAPATSKGVAAATVNGKAIAPKESLAPVPELKDLTPTDFDETTKKGYWFIKHYSPWCHHCIEAAPVWQTLYEFYLRSSPSSPSSPHPASPPSFSDTYDWHFANVNCAAHGDLCSKNNVAAYPMFGLFKDGKLVDKFDGKKNSLPLLSEFMEKHLEEIKPGSRPTKIELPQVPPRADYEKAHPTKAAEKATKAAEKATTPTQKAAADAPLVKQAKDVKAGKKGPVPNEHGGSVPLDAAEFQKRITNTRDGWFVKFYAPWCSHCQAMAPAWITLGSEMKGQLNIGEVNCEAQKRLCKDVNVKAYPTVLFFKNGERIEYDGLRGVGDLVSWARKAVDAGIKEIGDAADLEVLEKTNEVIFLFFYDHATVSEDFEALSRVTMPLIGHAPLYKTNSELLARKFRVTTWPQLVVLRDGRPSYYPALSPADIRDFGKMVDWMKTVWLPIVPELSATNSHEIMDGRTVVLGIFDRRKEENFALAKAEMKAAAKIWMDIKAQDEKQERQELRDRKQHRIDEAEDKNDERALRNAKGMPINLPKKREVGFAWVDGVFWERWVKTTYGFDVTSSGERVIINEEDKKLYWDETVDGEPIQASRTAILDTIKVVMKNPHEIKPKSTVGRIESFLRATKDRGTSHPFLTSIMFLVLIVFGIFWWRGRQRRTYHHVGMGLNPGNMKESNGMFGSSNGWFGNEKEGLFASTGGSGGKYD